MIRRFIVLGTATTAVVLASLALVFGPSLAWGDDDSDKSPLAKMMKKIDVHTKTVRDGTKSRTRFTKNNKAIAKAAAELAKYAKEFREDKEPSKKMKKPFEKWTDLTDRYEVASKEMEKAALKGDFPASQKAWKTLDTSCSNCHGAFRPEVGDGF